MIRNLIRRHATRVQSRNILVIENRRYLQTSKNELNKFNGPTYNIAIVGTGPGGFFTAYHLIQKQITEKPEFKIVVHLYDKNPTPFGLSRYGVAPDHPEVKKCEDFLSKIMAKYDGSYGSNYLKEGEEVEGEVEEGSKDEIRGFTIKPELQYFGNTEIGNDISLETLKEKYHSVVLLNGCATKDNTLNIPGIDLGNVIFAREFINWYNGHPNCHDGENKYQPPDLLSIKDVVVIGHGNVALDVARILLAPVEHWETTDISLETLERLKSSSVKNVKIIGRRGLFESAFTNKELRELLKLPKPEITFDGVPSNVLEALKPLAASANRVMKRRFKILQDFSNVEDDRTGNKTWSIEYLLSPTEVLQDSEGNVKGVDFVINEIQPDSLVKKTDKSRQIDTQLVILAVGYRGIPLPGFDEIGLVFEKGKLKNLNGKALSKTEEIIPGIYASGWMKTGPQGTIAITMDEAFNTAEYIFQDLKNNVTTEGDLSKKDGNVNRLDKSVSWEGWLKIDAKEKSDGINSNPAKPRVKIETTHELVDTAHSINLI